MTIGAGPIFDTKKSREHWLRRVLEAQVEVRRLGPHEFKELELIAMAGLQEIRSIWLYEKHEFDDSLPRIYEEVTGQPFPIPDSDDNVLRGEEEEYAIRSEEERRRREAMAMDVEPTAMQRKLFEDEEELVEAEEPA